MKILQINTIVSSGSVGRIAEAIGAAVIESGHKSYIAAAFTDCYSKSEVIKIGNKPDRYLHGLKTRLFDRHGFGSAMATKRLIKKIEEINPDIIHLHNLHGYYIHIGVLFDFLKKAQKPVVWTLHDCWPFTGHCSYFDRYNCGKWKNICFDCPNKGGYPASWLIDNSRRNFLDKQKLFTGLGNMVLVAPSGWLLGHIRNSFLSCYDVRVIPNGVDTNVFKPFYSDKIMSKYKIKGQYIIGVANIWTKGKGFKEFIKLRKLLSSDILIVLVGLKSNQIRTLPTGIIGIKRTDNINELAALYSGAEILVNPTYLDNFPSVNLEALACGSPVITYNTGGSPEAVDSKTGIIVEKGDIIGLSEAVLTILNNGKEYYSNNCRERAVKLYDSKVMCMKYLELYRELIK